MESIIDETARDGAAIANPAWKNRMKVGIVGAACAAMVLGGALAYFTTSDTLTNWFGVVAGEQTPDPDTPIDPDNPNPNDPDVTGDKLAISVETPEFAALEGETWLYPSVVVKQDPAVKSTDAKNMDSWAILTVALPAKAGATSADDGIFEAPTLASGWSELSAPALKDGEIVSTYGYDTKLAANSSTGALFDTLTYRSDLTFDDIKALPSSVSVRFDAFAIQAAGIADVNAAYAASGMGA